MGFPCSEFRYGLASPAFGPLWATWDTYNVFWFLVQGDKNPRSTWFCFWLGEECCLWSRFSEVSICWPGCGEWAGKKKGRMAKSFSLTLPLLLVGLVRCQLPGQESRILNNGGATRNQPPVLMRGGPTSGDLRNLQAQAIYMIIIMMTVWWQQRWIIIFFWPGVRRHSSRNDSVHTDRPGNFIWTTI